MKIYAINAMSMVESMSDKLQPRLRVLIVEDEMIVALFMEDLLGEIGYDVAGVVNRLDEAMARAPDYHMAVLDVHLGGKPVFDFADRLAQAGIPFVFATGYGERGIPERHRSRPVLQKPFVPEDLCAALKQIEPVIV
jgi:CheY-like chemotaxis protein